MRRSQVILASCLIAIAVLAVVSSVLFLGGFLPSFLSSLLHSNSPGDFQISATPNNLTILAGENATTTIRVKNVEHFPIVVYLDRSDLLDHFLSNASLDAISLPAEGNGTSLVLIHVLCNVEPKNYTLLFEGYTWDGDMYQIPHIIPVTVSVAGFTIRPSSSHLNLSTNFPVQSVINLVSVNGFSGPVDLGVLSGQLQTSTVPDTWCTVSFYPVAGTSVHLSANALSLGRGETANSTITVYSEAQGDFQIRLLATDKLRTQCIFLDATASPGTPSAVDFNITIAQRTLSLSQPGVGQYVQVTIASINDCFCIVHLSINSTSVAFGVGLAPLTVTVVPSQLATPAIWVFLGTTKPGNYSDTITVTGTSLNLSHSATMTVLAS